jgi:hypothetical protein
MDVVESIDWGAYSHFRFVAQHNPDILPWMEIAYYANSYAGVSCLAVLAVVLFLVQGRMRAAAVTGLAMAAGVGLCFICHFVVPRRRPPDAENFLGADSMTSSYPADGVLLFMLAMIFLGIAAWPLLRYGVLRGLFVVLAVALTVWICMSQFFLTIHFVSDVVGALAGAAILGVAASRMMGNPPGAPAPTA